MVRILRLNSGGVHRISVLDVAWSRQCALVSPIIGSIIASIQHTTKKEFNSRWKFSNNKRDYAHTNIRCYSHVNKDDASIQGEYLPLGVTRQSDFFGETITFVDNLNTKLLDMESIHSTTLMIMSSNNESTKAAIEDADDKNVSNTSIITTQQQSTKVIHGSKKNMNDAVSSFDGTSLCIISRGSANLHSGNDASGPDVQAYHASSLAWSELLRHAKEWDSNNNNVVVVGREQEAQQLVSSSITTAPMLVVATVAPVLAQGGSHYVRKIDDLLCSTTICDDDLYSSSSPPSLLTMAHNAVSYRDAVLVPSQVTAALDIANLPGVQQQSSDLQQQSPVLHHLLTPRERWHLHALNQLLNDNHRLAMGAYLRLLELYPGDLLGLSLALDVAYTLGDTSAALRAATNASTYWTERDGGVIRLQNSHPVQNMALSLIAVGLSSSSVSSRASTAERLAETALARDADGTGGTSVWALSHCLASEGRSAEMVSKLAGYDGTQFYEACGYLHFSSRMKGYGSIALLDRKGAGADRSAVRLYDGGYGSVLEYSGYNAQGLERGGRDSSLRDLRAPSSIKKDVAGALGSMLTGWFSGDDKSSSAGDSTKQKVDSEPSQQKKPKLLQGTTVEDVLCWLPPSPLLLTHATAVLLRLTLSGAISESDDRWNDIKAAWTLTMKEQDDHSSTTPIEYMPLALVAASLVIHPSELHMKEVARPLESAMKGMHEFGKLMKLGQLKVVPTSSSSLSETSSRVEEWRIVMSHLARARDNDTRWEMPTGIKSSTYIIPNSADILSDNSPPISHPIGWDFDMRQFLEYALIHASLEVGDYESLCLARAICSEGTTLRSNCPELWWRYGQVLDMLGDDVAAENARAASISLGSGEGGNTF
jgi:hypothetical protein